MSSYFFEKNSLVPPPYIDQISNGPFFSVHESNGPITPVNEDNGPITPVNGNNGPIFSDHESNGPISLYNASSPSDTGGAVAVIV